MRTTARLRVKITGMPKVQRKLTKMLSVALSAAANALYHETTPIMSHSKNIVPLDTGQLRGSGYATLPEETGDGYTVELGYGGPADYDIDQHENLAYRHAPGRQAKYLQEPVNARTGMLASTIAKAAEAIIAKERVVTTKPDAGIPQTPWEGPRKAEVLAQREAAARNG